MIKGVCGALIEICMGHLLMAFIKHCMGSVRSID